MKKSIVTSVLALLLLSGVGISAFGQHQVDIGINIPSVIGASYQGESVSEQLPFVIPLPDLMYNYYFSIDTLSIGVGFRAWSVIVASAAYPIVSAQIDTDSFVIQANIGGGIFGYSVADGTGGFVSGNVFFPELSAAFKITDWFHLGGSILGLYLPDVTQEGMGFSLNLLARFRVVN
jgi:hypothetical protein